MTIEEQIKALIKSKDYKTCADLLIKNTGLDKSIKPNNIDELEKHYSILFNLLNEQGDYYDLLYFSNNLIQHMKYLEKKDETHYHKGLPYHSSGIALYQLALSQFLKAFIEDVIKKKEALPLEAGRQHLQGFFKVNEDDLEKIGKFALELFQKKVNSSEEILDKYFHTHGSPYIELWQVENKISQIEIEIRQCINKVLGHSWMDNKIYLKGDKKEDIRRRQMREEAALGKAASNSLTDYLSFSDYAALIKEAEGKFKPIFEDVDEFQKKMNVLEAIRNKIAHFRKIFKEDIEILNETRKWLGDGLQKGLQMDKEDIPSQHWDSKSFATSGNIRPCFAVMVIDGKIVPSDIP